MRRAASAPGSNGTFGWHGIEPLEQRLMLAAQISVVGGPFGGSGVPSIVIEHGDDTPSLLDHTDMGSVTLNAQTASWTFATVNTGDATLNLAALLTDRVVISGAHADDFVLGSAPAATVAPGQSTQFTLFFNPQAVGLRTATVTINSDDPDTPSYSFDVQGVGIPKALTGAVEDQDFEISYDTLNAQLHMDDVPPTPMYRVQSVDSGTLKVNGADAVAGVTVISPGDTLTWRPDADANRTLGAFTIQQWDGDELEGDPIAIRVEVTPVEDDPTGEIDDMFFQAGGPAVAIDLLDLFRDPDVKGTVVRYQTVLGTFYVGLFDSLAPQNVANFLSYVSSLGYDNTIIHRSIQNFVIQGGGYLPQYPPSHIPTDDPVVNEFGVSNLRGTIAMAKVGNNPDSATSEWFFSLGDNSANLDDQNGGFTVFGEVLGNGMSVIDAIAAVPTYTDGGVFSNLPLIDYDEVLDDSWVLINSVRVVDPLTFEVVDHSNPELVSVGIVGG